MAAVYDTASRSVVTVRSRVKYHSRIFLLLLVYSLFLVVDLLPVRVGGDDAVDGESNSLTPSYGTVQGYADATCTTMNTYSRDHSEYYPLNRCFVSPQLTSSLITCVTGAIIVQLWNNPNCDGTPMYHGVTQETAPMKACIRMRSIVLEDAAVRVDCSGANGTVGGVMRSSWYTFVSILGTVFILQYVQQ